MATDPVCGMTVESERATAKAEHQGCIYYFCSTHCHDTFIAGPGKYVGTGGTAEDTVAADAAGRRVCECGEVGEL